MVNGRFGFLLDPLMKGIVMKGLSQTTRSQTTNLPFVDHANGGLKNELSWKVYDYHPENWHDNGKSQFLIGDTSSNG